MKVKYNYGSYNKSNHEEQWIRITEGCPNNCPFCYEPKEYKIFDIPRIVRNRVKIMDMNLIAKPQASDIITDLGARTVNNKRVVYELICGIDYRFMNQDLADLLKQNNFKNIRLAWDWQFTNQKRIKRTVDSLFKAGYKGRDITIFMLCNWKIPYKENCFKLDLCKVWGVKAADCYYDNQTSPNIKPIHWNIDEVKKFRAKVRKHNQLINFRIDPQYKGLVK